MTKKFNNNKNYQAIILSIILYIIALLLLIFNFLELAMIVLIIATIILITIILCFNAGNKDQNLLNKKEQLKKELSFGMIENGNFTLAKNGIYIPSTSEFIYFWDIILIYERPKFYGNSIYVYLYIITKDNKKYSFYSYSNLMTFAKFDLREVIIDKNPSVLIGKNKDNKKILKEKYNIIL